MREMEVKKTKSSKKKLEYMKEYNKKYYERRLKEDKDFNKKNYHKKKHTKGYIESHNKARNKWNEKNPEKRLAQIRAYDNVKIPKGQLCQICKINKAVERHHEDYSKPLEVMFLCFDCHRKRHLDTHAKDVCADCGHVRDEHPKGEQCHICSCKRFKPKEPEFMWERALREAKEKTPDGVDESLNKKGCGKDVRRFKNLKKIGGKYICKGCYKENRKNHREFLKRKVIKMRKRRSSEEVKEEQKKLNKIYKSIIPKIETKTKRQKINSLNLYISKDERLVLYKQLLRNSLNSEQANKRIDNLSIEMSNHLKKLRCEVKSNEELNIRFKEKFAELMENE